MRTTIKLHDDVLQQAKQVAIQSGRTLNAVVEDALRESLARRGQVLARPPITLTTVNGRGPLPGVDLDDSAALLEYMDARRGAP